MKNKAGKITIFVVCLMLGFLLALQFKSVRFNASQAQQPSRNEQLTQLLMDERKRSDSLDKQIAQFKSENDKFRADAEKSGGAATLLSEQLERAEILAGMTEVHGKGITITLADSAKPNTTNADENSFVVHDDDLLRVINELRAAGAEALSLNGERILATSEVRCAGATVSINNTRYGAPFVVRAIGDPNTMEKALMMRSGIVDELMTFNIKVDIQKTDDMTIGAIKHTPTYQFAKPVKKEGN